MADNQNVVSQDQGATIQAPEKAVAVWNKMDLAQQNAFVQKNTGFTPEKYGLSFKSATPVEGQQPAEQPTQQTTQQPTEQPTQQPEQHGAATVDVNKDDSPERLNQVKTNLDAYTNTNQELFKSRGVYDDYFKYDDRSDLQKKVLDEFRTTKGKKMMYNGMTSSQLAAGVANGDFSESDLDYLKVDDPTKYQQYDAAKTLENQKIQNNLLISSMNSLLGDKDNNGIVDYVDQLNKKADQAFQSYQQYQEAQTTPEMLDLQTNMSTLNQEIKTAQLDQIALKDKLISQYHGVPTSIINAMVADQTADLQDTIARKTITYNSMLGIYNSKLETIKNNYELETQRLKVDEEKFTNQLTSLQSMVGISKSIAELTTPAADKNIGEVINVGTTKSPKYMQWNTETQRYDIPVAGAAVEAGVGGGGGAGGISKTDLASQTAGESLDLLASTTRGERITAMSGAFGGIISPRVAAIQANYDYIKNNLMLGDFVQLKKQGATFGAMSNEEWIAIKSAATKLQYAMSDADWNKEISVIRQKMGAAAARAGVAQGSIQQMAQGTAGGTAQATTTTPATIKLPLNASFSKIIAPRMTQ